MGTKRILLAAAFGFFVAGTGMTGDLQAADAGELHPHFQVPCADCHLGREVRDPAERRNAMCMSCHAGKAAQIRAPESEFEPGLVSPAGLQDGADASGDDGDSLRSFACADCHSFHDPATMAPAGTAVGLDHSGIADHCQSCHSHSGGLSRLTAGHVAAGALYHSMGAELEEYSPSEACLICHDRGGPVPNVVPVHMPVIPRFDSHESHPYGVILPGSGDFFRSVIDARLRLPGGRIECQTCHDLTAQNEDLLVPFEAKYDLCHGCHTQGLPKNAREGLAQR